MGRNNNERKTETVSLKQPADRVDQKNGGNLQQVYVETAGSRQDLGVNQMGPCIEIINNNLKQRIGAYSRSRYKGRQVKFDL
ncbi:hypothetical protein D3C72_2288300 [compost metagenome]